MKSSLKEHLKQFAESGKEVTREVGYLIFSFLLYLIYFWIAFTFFGTIWMSLLIIRVFLLLLNYQRIYWISSTQCITNAANSNHIFYWRVDIIILIILIPLPTQVFLLYILYFILNNNNNNNSYQSIIHCGEYYIFILWNNNQYQ